VSIYCELLSIFYCDLLGWWNNGGSWVNMHWPMTHVTHPKKWPIWPTDPWPIDRDSRKSRQKNGKKHGKLLWKSQKSRQNHGKDTASNYGPEDHYTVYKTQDLALTTIIDMQCKVFICKILSLRSIILIGKIHISTMMSRSHIEQVSN